MTTTLMERPKAPAKGREPLRYPCGSYVEVGDTYTREWPKRLASVVVIFVVDEGVSVAGERDTLFISYGDWVKTNMGATLRRADGGTLAAGKRVLISRTRER